MYLPQSIHQSSDIKDKKNEGMNHPSSIRQTRRRRRRRQLRPHVLLLGLILVGGTLLYYYSYVYIKVMTTATNSSTKQDESVVQDNNSEKKKNKVLLASPHQVKDEWKLRPQNYRQNDPLAAAQNLEPAATCPYKSWSDFSQQELEPKQGDRHMVDPPQGGRLSHICCATTQGPLSMLVHHKWAPLGAQRFLEMVASGYMNHGVPLMRCIQNFLCQFGLSADVSQAPYFRQTLADDPNWLPEGPDHRQNENGVKRFAQVSEAALEMSSNVCMFVALYKHIHVVCT